MNKRFVFLFVVLLIFTLSACGNNNESNDKNNNAAEISVDGFLLAPSPLVPADIDAFFADVDGEKYTPVAYIGSKTNVETIHCVLCKAREGSDETYVIVFLAENADGDAEITSILECNSEVGTFAAVGSWTETDSPEVNHDVRAILNNATTNLDGISLKPLAFLATQIVSGTNYRILCEIKPITEKPEPYFAIVHIYEDLSGNAEITEVYEFVSTIE